MNKEEILKKAQEEKEDEGVEEVRAKGLTIGYKIFAGICIFLILFNLFNGLNTYDVNTLIFAFLAAEFYSRYKFTGEKKNKMVMILASITSIFNLVAYVLSVLR